MNDENLEDEADRGNIVVTDEKYSRITHIVRTQTFHKKYHFFPPGMHTYVRVSCGIAFVLNGSSLIKSFYFIAFQL